jgi:polyisoprenoid-binding protein YceI
MMKHYNKVFAALVLVLFITSYSFSQKAYLLKSNKVSVDGTSTLHDWSSAVTKLEWSGQLTVEGTSVKVIQNLVMTIPVESIKSEKGGMMDDKTYEAFKSDKNPIITFKLTGATIVGNKVNAKGTLTMAGVTKPIIMNVDAKVLADGAVHFSGSQPLNMRDYGMTPPKAVMGTIKVGEKVTVLFELIVTPQ